MPKRFLVRNSARSSFTQCRWQWKVGYLERLRPDEAGMNALVFGDIIHRALAGWYIPEKAITKVKRGVHPTKTVDQIFAALVAEKFPGYNSVEFDDARDLAVAMMYQYIDFYGNDEQYMIVHPEMPFQFDVYNEQGQYVCTLVGTTDALVMERSSKKLGMLEHKTAAQISTAHLFLDEQANTYWTIVPMWLRQQGILKPDQDITFMDYNFMRKSTLKDKPTNEHGVALKPPTIAKMKAELSRLDIDYSDCRKKDDYIHRCEENEIDWQSLGEPYAVQHSDLFLRERVVRNATQREKAFQRILEHVREMKMVSEGKLPAYKQPSKQCSWCQYKDLCEMDELGNDTEDFIKYSFHRWNPYRDHIWSLKIKS